MTLETFWTVTLREVFMCIAAASWRRGDRERHEMRIAWHTANLAGAAFSKEGMPALRAFVPPTEAEQRLEREASLRPMTIDEEVGYWNRLAKAHPQRKKDGQGGEGRGR